MSNRVLEAPLQRSAVLVLALVLSTSGQALAQGDALQPGARVRIQGEAIAGERLIGTVMWRSSDSVEIASSAAVRTRIPIVAIRELEISRGVTRKAGALRGLKAGLVFAGVMGGIGVLSIASASEEECYPRSCSGLAVTFVGASLLYGGGIGAATGAIMRAEGWQRATPPKLAETRTRRGAMIELGRFSFR